MPKQEALLLQTIAIAIAASRGVVVYKAAGRDKRVTTVSLLLKYLANGHVHRRRELIINNRRCAGTKLIVQSFSDKFQRDRSAHIYNSVD